MGFVRNALGVAVVCAAVLGPIPAGAALLSMDLTCDRDGWITRDTSTNLDWLDVNLTVNQTYDRVRTGVFYAHGFRHATKSEVEALFKSAETPDDGFDISTTYPAQTAALIAYLGIIPSSVGSLSTIGFTGSDFFGNTITTTNYPIGTRFSAQLGKIQYMDLRIAGLGFLGEAHFTGGHPFSDEASPSYGSFLVRPAAVGTASKCVKTLRFR